MPLLSFFFFFNDTATTEIYTLSLHDALPIFAGQTHMSMTCDLDVHDRVGGGDGFSSGLFYGLLAGESPERSEEHTSELQSRSDLVCRLLLEKKKQPEASGQPVQS